MFEKFVETLNNTGKAVGEKTKQGSDIVRANLKITSEERALNDIYCEIGKTYYENNSDNPCCDTMKELFEKVAEKTSVIESLRQQVRSIKGVIVCDNCGAEVSLENDFCGKCGHKLIKPEPVIEEEKAVPEEVIDHEDTVQASDENGEPTIHIEVAENSDSSENDSKE